MMNHLLFNAPLMFGRVLQVCADMVMDLFFVNSGYLVAFELFESFKRIDPAPVRQFYLRRAFRILPAFFAVLGVVWIGAMWLRQPMQPLWQFLTFTMNFTLDVRQTQMLVQAWSLCVEEHFYILLPVLFLVLRHLRGRVLAVVFASALLVEITLRGVIWHAYVIDMVASPDEFLAFLDWSPYFGWPTFTHLDGFVFGVAIATCRSFSPFLWEKLIALGQYWLLIAVLLFAPTYVLFSNKNELWGTALCFTFSSATFAALNLYSIAVNQTLFVQRLPRKLIRHLSVLTFPIYLVHLDMIKLMIFVFRKIELPNLWLMLFAAALMTYGTSLGLHVLVERRFLVWRKTLVHYLWPAMIRSKAW
jgi:peptidoglycan/LPS O-acetylase OafA/YrhL